MNKNELLNSSEMISQRIREGKFNKPKNFSWTFGRRSDKGGYKVMHLLNLLDKLWIGLIKYEVGHFQPIHNDGQKRHYKLNFVLKKSVGGDFKSEQPSISLFKDRILFFRADKNNPNWRSIIVCGDNNPPDNDPPPRPRKKMPRPEGKVIDFPKQSRVIQIIKNAA